MRFVYLLPIVCTLAHGFPQQTASESGRDQDVYAIYSQMLTDPSTSHGKDNNPRYLIDSETVPGSPREPCVVPPKERQADFAEVLADFELRRATPRELQRQFSIPKSYELITAADFDEFVKERSIHRFANRPIPNPRFQGVTDVFRLSDVYFNPRRNLALSFVSTWCGGLCGLFQWKVFEKNVAGTWEERPWVACSGIAVNFNHGRLTDGEHKAKMELWPRLLVSRASPPKALR